MQLEFGDYSVNAAAREVRRDGELLDIEPRAFELLIYLLEHRERAVGKDELQNEVWGTIVSDSAMTRSVMKLRKSLGGEPESVIKTVPRFGYRFIATLTEPAEAEPVLAERVRSKRGRWPAVAVLALSVLAVFWIVLHSDPPVAKSVAVLPFVDLSEAQDQAWFADGLAEEILNALARTPDLSVASKTSSFAFRDGAEGVSTIAGKLGVAHVLEGSVRRDADRVRVSAKLIRAEDGFHVWSENFDHDYSDLITIQEAVATKIANALQTTMDPELLASFVSSGTASVPAFEAYLQGLADYDSMLRTGNVDTYTGSISSFQRAVEIDPNFGLAWFEIAEYWAAQMSLTGILSGEVDLPREELFDRFESAINSAVEHANDPVSKIGVRAMRASEYLELRKALQLNTEYLAQRPNDRGARDRQMVLLGKTNRYDELREFVEQLFAEDEREVVTLARALLAAALSGDREMAESAAIRSVDRVGFNAIGLYQLHRAWLWSGSIQKARSVYEDIAASEMPAENLYLAKLRQLCAEGRTDEADALYAYGIVAYRHEMTVVWISHTIMGEHVAATEMWRPMDNGDMTLYSGVIQYSTFDPQQYPNLSLFLTEHGNEPGPVQKIPFRCYD